VINDRAMLSYEGQDQVWSEEEEDMITD